MALSLGKITILLGAGFVGSVMAKEGGLPDVSGLVSGAFKVVLRQLKSNDPTPTVKKPHNDALIDQVNSLRQELQNLARERSITIVNASGTGGRKYVTGVVIVVVAYGYIRWKGWIPNMMFATRRSLSDACKSIGIQMGKVYEAIEDAKKKISGRVDNLDEKIDECAAIAENVQKDIPEIQHDTGLMNRDVQGFQVALLNLRYKLEEIEKNQVDTIERVGAIVEITYEIQNGSIAEYIEGSSSNRAIELPPVTPSSRAAPSWPSLEQPSLTPLSRIASLPPTRPADPQSPSNTVESYQSSQISEINLPSSSVGPMKTPIENKTNGSSSGGFFGLNLSSVYTLTRTRSATNAVLQQTRPSS
ncbi:uncharacterized protein [Cicer arietinum]|uniref:Uncharacterized protein LOC101495514 isoform X2 n=1 Tax=Cicer arietinum TaxID=3827 RepID=A0A1S3E0G0_CICAR|nr:uncharacterized protein LOC101495514 isoform X2 [Cicer arietinum]